MSASADGCISYWDITTKKSIGIIKDPKDSDIYSMDISKSGTQIAVGGKDYHVKVYDYEKKRLQINLEPGSSTMMGHSNNVYSVKFGNDPNILLSGGWDVTIYIWDLRIGKSIGYLYGPHIFGDALDVHGDTILTGNYDRENVLQLWSMSRKISTKLIEWNSEPHDTSSGYVYSARFEKDERCKYIVASGRIATGQNEIRLFNNDEKHELLGKIKMNTTTPSIDFMNTKHNFAACSNDEIGRAHV